MSEQDKFQGWAILEVLGHRKLGGMLSETQIAGHGFLRIDFPRVVERDGQYVRDGADIGTQFYPPAAIFCITPTTEPMACAVARCNHPQPVTRYELPAVSAPVPLVLDDDIAF